MGIHYWSKSAVLTLLVVLSIGHAHAATRKAVNHGQTPGSIVSGNGSSFSTPNGEAAFFGQEYVDQHTAGNRFNAGDKVPSSGSGKISVKVTPVAVANRAKVAAKAISSIKGGVPGVVATAAIQWAIDQIPGAEVIDNQPVMLVPGAAATGTPSTTDIQWCVSGTTNCAYNAKAACQLRYPAGTYHYSSKYGTSLPVGDHTIKAVNDTQSTCSLQALGYPDFRTETIVRTGTTCPSGGSYSTTLRSCTGAPQITPFNDSDYVNLEDVARQVANSEWTRELMKKSCEGSIAPQACLDNLADLAPMKGPASQKGPKESTTTTTQNPDGTTSQKTETTQTEYNYNFGDNYYNYTSTTTKTTTQDGQTTTETTTDAQPEGELPNNNEDDTPDQDWDISFDDSEYPAVTPFYDQKYPDGLSGVWSKVSTDIDNSAFIGFLKSFVPTFSGSCPTFGLSFNIASWANYGAVSFWNMCWIFDFIKIIMLVTAVFTARALTFGG